MAERSDEAGPSPSGSSELRQRAAALLKQQSCFADCAMPVIEEMTARAIITRLAKGETLYRHGDPGDRMTIVLSGSLKVVNITGDAREVVLAFLGAGALIGEIAVLDGHARTASVVAMETVESVTILRRDLIPILRANPDAMMALLQAMCGRLRTTIALVESYSLETEARIAAGLVRLASQHGRDKGGEITIGLKMSQRDLGNHLGLTRETISRSLGDLKARGVIEMRGQSIVITDSEGLGAIAEGLGD
ncbi:MAG: Crp/Fnr family transcriptional regulator [Hyphomicrobiaceae bacterium]